MSPQEVRAAILSLSDTVTKKKSGKLAALLEFVHFNHPYLECDPEVRKAMRLKTKLPRAGLIENRKPHYSAGAPGLGKTR